MLRKTPFNYSTNGQQLWNGVRFVYVTGQERGASKGNVEETQAVVPAYVVGDEIYAVKLLPQQTGIKVKDGTNSYETVWLDLNLDGRAWAAESQETAATGATAAAGLGLQHNFQATVDPAATNDAAEGYGVGSVWCNLASDTYWVCLDNAINAAVWKETTAGGGGGAPTNAQYVALAGDATLTQERVLTAGRGVLLTDAGAGSTVTLDADHYKAVAVQSITGAATAITATDGSPYRLVSSDAAYTLTAEPTIAAGRNGQAIFVKNVGSFNVALQDVNALGGSLLRLTANTLTIQPGGTMKLIYDSTIGFWIEQYLLNPQTFTPSISGFTVDGASSLTHEWGDGSTANDTVPAFAMTYVGSPSAASVTLTVSPDPGYPLTITTPFLSGTGAAYFRSSTRDAARTFRVTATVAGTAGLTRDVIVTYRAPNYAGVSTQTAGLTSAQVVALTHFLDINPFATYSSIPATGAGDYVWFAFVDNDATLDVNLFFAIGGERAKFSLKNNPVSVTSTYLKVANYETYRSEIAQLGTVTVVVQNTRPPTRRYVGKAATTGPLTEATIEALQLSDLTESPNGTFASITGLATGQSVWFCVSNANIAAPTHYGLSPGNGSTGYQEASFTAAALVNVTNVYGYAEDYKEIYSNVSELQAVNINGSTGTTWSLKTQAAAFANRIYMGPGPSTQPITNASILALDNTAGGQSNLNTSLAGTYTNIVVSGTDHFWLLHPDAVADFSTMKYAGIDVDGAYEAGLVSHTNDFGVVENYRAWRSTNPGIFPTNSTIVIT